MLYHVWAQKDPEAAMAAFGRLSPSPEDVRCQALGALIFGIAPTCPDLARKLAVDHLALLAGGGGFVSGSPFPENFPKSDAFWKVLSSLPEDPLRNRVLAGYLSKGSDEAERKRRWSEATPEMRESLVAGGFPENLKLEDPVFEGLSAMVVEQAVKSGDQHRLYRSMEVALVRSPDELPVIMAMAQENLTGRNRTELPAYLLEGVAKRDFPRAFDYWRTLPDGLTKIYAAAKLQDSVPPEYQGKMSAEIAKISAADQRRIKDFP